MNSALYTPRSIMSGGDPFIYDSELSPTSTVEFADTCTHEIINQPTSPVNPSSSAITVSRTLLLGSTTACQVESQQGVQSRSLRPNLPTSGSFKSGTQDLSNVHQHEECRPRLARSDHSEISVFDSDSDSNFTSWAPILSTVSKLFRKSSKSTVYGQSDGIDPASPIPFTCIPGSLKTKTIYANVHKKRQVLHIRHENGDDLLLYERLHGTTCVLAGTLEMLLTEFTRPASKITDPRYMDILILNHGFVMSSLSFFRELSKHFWVAFDTGHKSVATKTLDILSIWLRLRPQDLCSQNPLTDMLYIFTGEARRDGFPVEADLLETVATQYQLSDENGRVGTGLRTLMKPTPLSLEGGRALVSGGSKPLNAGVESARSRQLASYLAVTSLILVRSVLEPETIRYWLLNTTGAYKGVSRHLRGLDSTLKRNAMLEHWTCSQVSVCSSKAAALKMFLLLLQMTHQLGIALDVNSTFCMVNGLNKALQNDKFNLIECLQAEAKQTWIKLNDHALHNFQKLSAAANKGQAVVPSLNILLSQISRIYGIPSASKLNCRQLLPSHIDSSTTDQAQSYLQSSIKKHKGMIDIEKFKLLDTHLSKYRKLFHSSEDLPDSLVGSTSFGLQLYGQGVVTSMILPEHGELDEFGALFEHELIRTWSGQP